MQARGLAPHFSLAAIAEAQAMRESPVGNATLRDQRALGWASIDSDDSRDLDQLSVAEALPGGVVRVYVAIADDDALVKRGSAIDLHASANTTSVYTAAGSFPMVPEVLSTDLTSLGEGAPRLAMVAELDVAEDGGVRRSDPYRARVFNREKLAYDSVAGSKRWAAPQRARRRRSSPGT